MHKIDLAKGKWHDYYWEKGPAWQALSWLNIRTKAKASPDKQTWYLIDNNLTNCDIYNFLQQAREMNAKSTGILQKVDGPGWSIITYACVEHAHGQHIRGTHCLTIDVLIDDDTLAVEFKLMAPWGTVL
jgi:hypothetical protein